MARRFQALFDHSPIGRSFVDMDGRITAANQALSDMLGYPIKDLIGRMIVDLIAHEDRGKALADADAILTGAKTHAGAATQCIHADGHLVPARAYNSLIRNDDGQPLMWASIMVDRTAEQRSHDEIEQAHEEAIRAADRLKFLNTVAHIANEADLVDDLVPRMLTTIADRFGWQAGAFVRWNGDDAEMVHAVGPERAISNESLRSLTAPADATPDIRRVDDETLVVLPLHQTSATTLALVFAVPGTVMDKDTLAVGRHENRPEGIPHEFLTLIAGECARMIERHIADRTLRDSEGRFRSVFDSSPFPMALTLGDTGTFNTVNEAWCELFGRPRAELIGTSIKEFTHPDDISLPDAAGEAAANASDGRHDFEMRIINASGQTVFARVSLAWLSGPDDDRMLLAQIEDVTARRGAERALQRQAETDSLTQLANRFHLVRVLGDMDTDIDCTSVLFVDLDGFKVINDARGPDVGDEVLIEVARRLKTTVGAHNLVTRFGGDEFVIVCHGRSADLPARGENPHALGLPSTLPHRIAHLIETALTAPIATSSGPLQLTASIGISEPSSTATTGLELLQHADVAMSEAKARGKDRWVIYDAHLHRRAIEYRQTEALLRTALDEQRFVAHFQPIVTVMDGTVVGFEALVRMLDQHGRLVPPSSFITVAEQSGLVVPMGAWMLRESCQGIADLCHATGRPLSVSVNIAARQAARTDLMRTVNGALDSTGMAPTSLTLELTESALLDADETTLKQLTTLRDQGIRIALDDFGTGYSSLTYLRQFPVSHVKVDRSFVMNMTKDPDNAAIVRAVTRLADDLGLQWIAEGVETDQQWGALRALGAGFAQGYLFARPAPKEELTALLAMPPRAIRTPVT